MRHPTIYPDTVPVDARHQIHAFGTQPQPTTVSIAVIFVLLTLVAMADPFQAGSVAGMVNVIQGVAVILAGILPLLALGQVQQ